MQSVKSTSHHTRLVADWQSLMRTFILPAQDASRDTLVKYMEQILFGLHGFLKAHVGITEEVSLKKLAEDYTDTLITQDPEKKLGDVITGLIKDIAPHAVNVASPYFIGHMTSAIPFFMVHLKTIVAALNQNVVKLETSKVVSVVEKQVLAKIHRLIYAFSEDFYATHVQSVDTALGCFVEDGTLANITALWVARNQLFPPKAGFAGISTQGVAAAHDAYGVERCVVLVSRLGHYSLKKAGGVLGLGSDNIIAIDADQDNRIDLNHLTSTLNQLQQHGSIKVMAIVGIAGTTETGTVDPLKAMARICAEHQIHFHVDAAWGGPTLLSQRYRPLLEGIQKADSVTIDGHKQFYMPMTCGMVYFKNPFDLDSISYHANYVNRPGTPDLGIKSISGSREASSLILDSALKIMGSRGYALLIEHGIETAHAFAEEIVKRPAFQLVSSPQLNILTYRFCPPAWQEKLITCDAATCAKLNQQLNAGNIRIQRLQREAGNSFVSRTILRAPQLAPIDIVVLRCVIMNPLTTPEILNAILDEQTAIGMDVFDGA